MRARAGKTSALWLLLVGVLVGGLLGLDTGPGWTQAPAANAELADQALKLLGAAVDRDEYESAAVLGQLAEDAARKTKDLPLVLLALRERKWVAATKQQFAAVKPFLDKLEKDPTNA